MLQVNNLTKHFGGVKALNNCTFEIKPVQITALVGPNGAGKTTLFDIISGLVPADRGEITFENQLILKLPPHAVTQLGISRTWQQVRLFKYLTIKDHLILASPEADETELLAYMKHFGIDRPLNTIVSELSYGQRKLLQLAMVTFQPHKIMLLDEPVAGVSQVIQEKIEQMLLHLKAKGETIVVIEHDMEFVKKLAEHVIVLDAGRVLTQGRPDVVLQDKRVLEAYLGE